MNTTIRSIRAFGIFEAIKRLFQVEQVSYQDDLTVCSSRESILKLAGEIEGKNIPIVIHFTNGAFTKVVVVKVLNGSYLITEESRFLNTTANLVHIKEILSVSIKTIK